MIFETRTEHRGRTLDEQQSRHKQATGHKRVGKLQVREEKFEIVGSGFKSRAIFVFQECLDCKDDNAKTSNWDLDELQAMSNKQLIGLAQSIGARGHKQMNKSDLIESIIDKYENTAIIPNP